MGRHDGSGGKWCQRNSGSRKSRLGHGGGQRRRGRTRQPQQPGQQFPVIRAEFRRQDSQSTDQPSADGARRTRGKRGRRSDDQK